MVLLSQESMAEIISKASTLGLAAQRNVLLASIDARYVQRLETNPVPYDQMVLDLWEMNRTVSAVGDGVPLKQWLLQAAGKTAHLQESEFFRNFAEQVHEQPPTPVEKAAAGAQAAMEALKALASSNPEIGRAVKNARDELESITRELKPVGVHKRLHDLFQSYQIENLPIITEALSGAWTEDDFRRHILTDMLDTFARTIESGRTELEKLRIDSRDRKEPEGWLASLASKHSRLSEVISKSRVTEALHALKDFRADLCRRMSMLNLLMSRRADDLRINRLVEQLRSFASDCLTIDDERAIKLRTTASQLSALDADIGQLLTEHDRWQSFEDELWSAEGNFLYEGDTDYGLKTFSDDWPHVVARVSELGAGDTASWIVVAMQYEQSFAQSCPLPINPPIAVAARKQFRDFVKTVRTQFYSVDHALVARCNRLSVLTDPIEDLAQSL